MPRIAVMSNMNPNGPNADFHAPHDRDQQQQQFVDFPSRVYERTGGSEGDGDGSTNVGGYDSRYPNSALNYSGNNDDGNEDSMSIPRTPATPRHSLAAATAATNTDPAMMSTVSRFGRDFSRLAATTPFATVGHTPLTGASLGSSYDPTPRSSATGSGILKTSNYGAANVRPSECNAGSISMNAGISAMGLVRGNDPLGPTPLVRRNVPGKNRQQQQQQQSQQLPTPSPGIHYHFPATSGVKSFDGAHPPRKRDVLPSVEEEDPAMLRYASMAGSDQSPLVSRGASNPNAEQNDDKKDLDEIEASRTPPTYPQVSKDGLSREQSASAYVSIGATPQAPPTQPPPDLKAPAALSEFPFYFDGYASWVCRHCNHISPYYRGENYIWHFPQAPPNEFVDHHLMFCPGLNANSESVSSQQQHQTQQPPPPQTSNDYRFHPTVSTFPRIPAGGGMSFHMQQQQQHPVNKQKSAPDPPTGRSPPTILPNHERKGDGSEAPPYFHVQSYPNRPFQAGQQPYNIVPPHAAQSSYIMPPHGSQPPPFPFGLSGPVDASPSRTKRRSTGKNVSPKGRPSDDDTYTKAMEHLERVEEQMPDLTEPDSDIGSSLVEKSDSDLITDYFYHIMKQLVVCRFAEKDRKTRGGKRENVNIGYGGLQCRHCINAPSSRKFFWSNVDRLANSFAEIPTHVLKCKSTPEDIKDSLLVLKGRHPVQMQMLARGSQKVFFRRMWRRLHDGDATRGTPMTISEKPSRDESEASGNASEDASKSGDKQPNAASVLVETLEAESAKTASRHGAAFVLAQSMNTGSNRGVLLAIPEDKEWLSDDQCFVRNNIEVFVANSRDCEAAAEDCKYPIKPGQIGIRCMHCAQTLNGARGSAVFYPYTISGIYESVREFQRMHFEKCENLPPDIVKASKTVSKASTTLSSVLRRYYVQSARALGLMDASEGGIKAGAKPEPMSRAGFSSPTAIHRAASASAKHNSSLVDPANLLLEMSRKRKAQPDPFDEVHSPSKRQHSSDEEHDYVGTSMKQDEI